MFIIAETSKQHMQKRQEENQKGDNEETNDTVQVAQDQAQKVSPEAEKFLRMLQVHNSKTGRNRAAYIQYMGLRERAAKEGLDFNELKE